MERGVSSHVKVGKKPIPDQVTSVGEDYMGSLCKPTRHSDKKDDDRLPKKDISLWSPAGHPPRRPFPSSLSSLARVAFLEPHL